MHCTLFISFEWIHLLITYPSIPSLHPSPTYSSFSYIITTHLLMIIHVRPDLTYCTGQHQPGHHRRPHLGLPLCSSASLLSVAGMLWTSRWAHDDDDDDDPLYIPLIIWWWWHFTSMMMASHLYTYYSSSASIGFFVFSSTERVLLAILIFGELHQ